MQEWSTKRQVGFMKKDNIYIILSQACSLSDDIKNREDSLHALSKYFMDMYVSIHNIIYVYSIKINKHRWSWSMQYQPKHAKLWKHTRLTFKTIFKSSCDLFKCISFISEVHIFLLHLAFKLRDDLVRSTTMISF